MVIHASKYHKKWLKRPHFHNSHIAPQFVAQALGLLTITKVVRTIIKCGALSSRCWIADCVVMAPVFGYWAIRGLAEPIRLLLKYLGVEYEEKMYTWGPAPDYDRSQWLNEKFTLGLDFPNLPYYIDGDFKITQSLAILEYVADKHDMVPNCKKTRAILHMIANDIMDLRMSFAKMCYGFGPANAEELFMKELPKKLGNYQKYLGDHDWLTGNKINYPDFFLCEVLNTLVKWDSKVLDEFPKLRAYLHRFENLPALKEYMASKEFRTRPCNFVTAKWRGDCE